MFRYGTALFIILILVSGVAKGQAKQAKLAHVIQSSGGKARTVSPSFNKSQIEASKKSGDGCEQSPFLMKGMCKAWNYVFLPR